MSDHENNPDPMELVERLAEECAAKLAEHCDSVVIVCTFPRPAEDKLGPRTGLIAAVRGNYYAQQGSVTQWLEGNPEFEQPPEPTKRPPEDGDEWKEADV